MGRKTNQSGMYSDTGSSNESDSMQRNTENSEVVMQTDDHMIKDEPASQLNLMPTTDHDVKQETQRMKAKQDELLE